jgi:hypothetical protein
MSRFSYVAICVWANLGIFMICASLLPRTGLTMSSDPVSHFVSSRAHWDTAFGVLAGTVMLSVALGLYLETRQFFVKPNSHQRDMAFSWFMVGILLPLAPALVLLMFWSVG